MQVEINFTWWRERNGRDYIETNIGYAPKFADIEHPERFPRIVAKGRCLDRYQPLKEFPDLYERFAGLQTQADVIKFVRAYGPLTEDGFPGGKGDNLFKGLSQAKSMKAGNLHVGEFVSALRLVSDPLRLQIEPSSLIDALWVQFAQAASKGDAQHCKQCGILFATGPDAKRRRKATFCSSECKTRFHSLQRSR